MSIIQDAKEKLGEDNLNLILQEILTSIDGISLNTNEVLSAIKREKTLKYIQNTKEKLGEDNLYLILQEILTPIDDISLNTNEVLSAIKREKTLKHRHVVEGVPKGRPNKVDEAFENWKEFKKAGKDQEAEDAVDNFKKNFGTTSAWKLQKKINYYLEKQGSLFGN